MQRLGKHLFEILDGQRIEPLFEGLPGDLDLGIDPMGADGQLVEHDHSELKDIEHQGLEKNAASEC